MIPTPGHGSFPMGHACEAWALAELLLALCTPAGGSETALQTQLRELARRIADNRIIAGVHFRVDLPAGTRLGEVLVRYFLNACRASYESGCGAGGNSAEAESDAGVAALVFDPSDPSDTEPEAARDMQRIRVPVIQELGRIWEAARHELRWLRPPQAAGGRAGEV